MIVDIVEYIYETFSKCLKAQLIFSLKGEFIPYISLSFQSQYVLKLQVIPYISLSFQSQSVLKLQVIPYISLSFQSQSVLKLQVDDEEQDDKVLTCFLFPQDKLRPSSSIGKNAFYCTILWALHL